MNQSFRIAQRSIDEVIAEIVGLQLCMKLPSASQLERWHSRLDTARLELMEFAARESEELFTNDMQGVNFGTTGE